MKIERYRPVFEFQDYTINFELSKEARRLLVHLQHLNGDERYCYIQKGFIPLDYSELSKDLDYPKSIIHKCFLELEKLGFVDRCIARFVHVKVEMRDE
jgi:hypothetical protein